MGFANITEMVAARPEDVFEVAVRTDRLPEWLTLIVDVRDADPRLDESGAGFTSTLKIGSEQLEAHWRVESVNASRSLRVEGSAGDDGEATFRLALGPWEGGCRASIEVDWELPGSFLARIADRLFVERTIARELRNSLGNLKDIVEEHGSD